MTTGQVALVLELSGTRVRQLADAGTLQSIMTPLGRLINADSVRDYLERRLAASASRQGTHTMTRRSAAST